MNAIISITHVEHWYNEGQENATHALKDINLQILQGDYVAFFGPSGCGKTTLLYAASGIDRVSKGEIFVNNRDITKFSNQELAIFRQTGIGIVFQQFNLVPSLTVIENIALPMAFVGVTKKKAEIEAQKLAVRFGLEKHVNQYPAELSGGQQQRVGIARALANNPPILIADEPLGNLDSVNAQNVLAILKELNEQDGKTIIMVTHEAWSLKDVRTIFNMKDGAIVSVEHRTMAGEGVGGKDVVPAEVLVAQVAKEAKSADATIMMVRILSNFLMRGQTFEETRRFENFLGQRLADSITASKFQSVLGMRFANGGVGLWKKKAERVSVYIERLIEKQEDLNAIIEFINVHPEFSMDEEVRQIRNWILMDYVGKVSLYKSEILDELIANRIRRFITSSQFLQLLQLPVKKFGAGFPIPSAQTIAERLEMIVGGSEEYAPKV